MSESYPIITVNRLPECECDQDKGDNLLDTYIAKEQPPDTMTLSAILELDGIRGEYPARCRKAFKKTPAPIEALRGINAGYVCHIFSWPLHIPDVVEINHSKPIRSGGPMKDSYLRSVEEMGGSPKSGITPLYPNFKNACNHHWRQCWGVFKKIPGYTQGEIITGEKLLGYISLQRIGELALYAMLLGHGAYLKDGIVFQLHFATYNAINQEISCFRGIKYLMYGGYYSGTEGLNLWKRKCLFHPYYLKDTL